MSDFVEVEFIGVETSKSGDAITIRYSKGGEMSVHIVDGGYIDTGTQIIDNLKKHYGSMVIDNVVLTHPDRDHANGLRIVLEECDVKALWLNRPWIYAQELLPRFANYNSADALERKLKSIYDASAALEEIAIRKGIPIYSPFQGEVIGAFHVLSPSRERYLDLIVESEKTPEAEERGLVTESMEGFKRILRAAANLIRGAWGHEYFPPSGTSSENEMSVVQYANINGANIVLTGDTGRDGLKEAADYAPYVGLQLPGVNLFQVPHHGGRHNVSTEILDRWLGPRLDDQPKKTTWSAVCSSAKADEDHPRKSVVRAMLHRGAHFSATEGRNIYWARGVSRDGWNSLPQIAYPEELEQ
ncbi:ComEC/Rec2 family competence protein [Pseudomonas sp. GXZC]|uniref:ComEC/Rec2 family competence protein n=1 Tax=Pseudomonas sp. GXZC TaxID=3003351 RepID=UPI0022AA7645|nr:competence protein ComEC [Pseudomonas sp. GXZC]WAT26169.1 competence protein ComEC [Pseudomonas sp. GXZC]